MIDAARSDDANFIASIVVATQLVRYRAPRWRNGVPGLNRPARGCALAPAIGDDGLAEGVDHRRLPILTTTRHTERAADRKAPAAAKIPACVKFLAQFDTIFTLNYDLLLYWVILANTTQFQDGFGLAEDRKGFRCTFKMDAYCNVFNLHGGLHLFKTEDDLVEKRIDQGSGVIDAIASTITNGRRLPCVMRSPE